MTHKGGKIVVYPFKATIIAGPGNTIKILQKIRRHVDNALLPTLLLFPDCKAGETGRQAALLREIMQKEVRAPGSSLQQ